jgi:hypothetical protein
MWSIFSMASQGNPAVFTRETECEQDWQYLVSGKDGSMCLKISNTSSIESLMWKFVSHFQVEGWVWYLTLIAFVAENVFAHRYVIWKISSKCFFHVNPKFMKRWSFKLDLERCVTGKFHQRCLGFYRKATYVLTDCECKWVLHPFMFFKSSFWKAILKIGPEISEMSNRIWGLIC